MTFRTTQSTAPARLRASANFVLAFTLDGRPYVAKETEPYIQYWLSERYRVLHAMFSGRGGATIAEAVDGYLRCTGASRGDAERKRVARAIEDMRKAGVLVDPRDDTSRYDARIVDDYVTHRPFPRELAGLIIKSAPVEAHSRVLDLAGGPGDLALALAQASREVSLMELSRGFLAAAGKRARTLGVNLTPVHDSCNRLMFRDEHYDVITVSQALHWLDDVLVCRGILRVLRPGGSFFVIHSAIELDDRHPLAYVLGNDSILGRKARQSFAAEVEPIRRRLTLLFDALDAPDVERVDPAQRWDAPDKPATARIVPARASLFRQRRPFGLGYVRGFLTPRHIEAAGQAPAVFWKDLEARCAASTADQFVGTHHWAVLQFCRGGVRAEARPLQSRAVTDIGFETAPVVATGPIRASAPGSTPQRHRR